MRKLTAALFMTLDGVVEAPGHGDTTLPEHRGWSERFMNEEIGGMIMSQMDATDAMLLGRRTYQDFAAFWPNMPEEDPFAQRMNNQTKYVVSTTLTSADWKNSTLLKGDIAQEIAKLKQQSGKNISVVGSGTLVYSLLQLDLLDELQLLVCPVILGVGKRVFTGGNSPKTLKLTGTKGYSSGMVLLTYAPENA